MHRRYSDAPRLIFFENFLPGTLLNPSVTIAYQLQKDASIRLEVYDIAGRRVQSLVDGGKVAGYCTVVWNGRDKSGSDVSSGVYLYRLTATPTNGEKAFSQSGKLMLTR